MSARVDEFVENGFVVVRGAVPRGVVEACRGEIDEVLRARGIEPDDPTTWTTPVERLSCPETPVFAEAGTQPALWKTYEELLGRDGWWRRRGVGGTIAVRFPHPDDPGDAGWHIDGSYEVDGEYWVNVNSRERGLLCLFLFSDVGAADAPTELKVGSHLDVAAALEPSGEAGAPFGSVVPALPRSSPERPSALATGAAGDVVVCHPFLVHRATWPHRGDVPRVVAQPGVLRFAPFALDGAGTCPVEQAILRGLGRHPVG